MTTGESLLVPEEKVPLEIFVAHAFLYHGSPVRSIQALHAAVETTVGEGVYFTPSPEPAIGYSHHRTRGYKEFNVRPADTKASDVARVADPKPVLYKAEIHNVRFAYLRNDGNVRKVLQGFRPVLFGKMLPRDRLVEPRPAYTGH